MILLIIYKFVTLSFHLGLIFYLGLIYYLRNNLGYNFFLVVYSYFILGEERVIQYKLFHSF